VFRITAFAFIRTLTHNCAGRFIILTGLFVVLLSHFRDNPTCERCLQEDESATHILCDCEATAYLKFRHLDQLFMGPSDYYDALTNKVLHFIRNVELKKG
jgi:hypothetical protein